MSMKKLSAAIAVTAMTMSGSVLADALTLKEVLDASGITVTGYVDAAYNYYNLDQSQQHTKLNYLDNDSNTFTVKQTAITIASQPKVGFGAVVTAIAGNDARSFDSDGNEFDLTQAFVQYSTGPDNVMGEGITVIGGKFFTLMGAEVVAPTGNTNISRSIAFLYAIPFTDTGVRLAWTPTDSLTLYAGAINSTYGLEQDNNSQKSIQLGFAWVPTPAFSWALTVDDGKDASGLNGKNTDVLVLDTVLTIKPSDSLSLVLNYDMGNQDDAVLNSSGNPDKADWDSIIGYINYQFSEEWRVSLRGEQFNDKDGYKLGLVELDKPSLPLAKKTTAYTMTVGFAPKGTNFELRGEVRQDTTDGNALVDTAKVTDKQLYAAIEGLYKF